MQTPEKLQVVDLYKPMQSDKIGPAPVVVRAVVIQNQHHMVGGVPPNATKVENYVLLSALPTELQERVKMAVQAVLQG